MISYEEILKQCCLLQEVRYVTKDICKLPAFLYSSIFRKIDTSETETVGMDLLAIGCIKGWSYTNVVPIKGKRAIKIPSPPYCILLHQDLFFSSLSRRVRLDIEIRGTYITGIQCWVTDFSNYIQFGTN